MIPLVGWHSLLACGLLFAAGCETIPVKSDPTGSQSAVPAVGHNAFAELENNTFNNWCISPRLDYPAQDQKAKTTTGP
jgi:hypothetical protein